MSDPVSKCRLCGGTRWELYRRSWFTVDGFYRIQCRHCCGSGEADGPHFDAPMQAKHRQQATLVQS